jgi:hypothetical protein
MSRERAFASQIVQVEVRMPKNLDDVACESRLIGTHMGTMNHHTKIHIGPTGISFSTLMQHNNMMMMEPQHHHYS